MVPKLGLRLRRPETPPWRFEYKYVLSSAQCNAVRNALIGYMVPDRYSRLAPGGRYLVRSIYFDNDRYDSYFEKIEGNFGRIKYRIRAYSECEAHSPQVRVELKARWGHSIEKYSTFTAVEDYRTFMQQRHWPDRDDVVLVEFERLLHLKHLRPRVLVQYRREGFEPRARGDLRVTLDHGVQSAASSSLFPRVARFRHHRRHSVILEIKCRQARPAWLTELVLRHGLRYVANSKYTQGVEVACWDLSTPY